MDITAGLIHAPQDLAVAHSIRLGVFVAEQSVAEEIELDGLDEQCRHFMAYRRGQPVGTARLRATEQGYKIERVAVLASQRRRGVGTRLVQEVLSHVPPSAGVYVHAQVSACGFWQGVGFRPEGLLFDEGGLAHRRMAFSRDRRPESGDSEEGGERRDHSAQLAPDPE